VRYYAVLIAAQQGITEESMVDAAGANSNIIEPLQRSTVAEIRALIAQSRHGAEHK
jgi:hypothetical protein